MHQSLELLNVVVQHQFETTLLILVQTLDCGLGLMLIDGHLGVEIDGHFSVCKMVDDRGVEGINLVSVVPNLGNIDVKLPDDEIFRMHTYGSTGINVVPDKNNIN
jgi:hypothetical protein